MPAPPRVTELSNPVTSSLSASSPVECVRLLSACDAQLFTGTHGLPSVHEFVEPLARVSSAIGAALRHPRGRVVFAGCGTSGRLAHLLSATYGRGRDGRVDALLAGGDAALLVPAESIEDRADVGASDFRAWLTARGLGDDDPTVLVGISCGLSATYVASALAASLERPRAHTVALGFNAREAIVHVSVPGEGTTFTAVLDALAASDRADIINPVVGAEAVAGSSRMKGGSATWVICAALCEEGIRLARSSGVSADALTASTASIRASLLRADTAVRSLYSTSIDALASLVDAGARALGTRRAPPAMVAAHESPPAITEFAPTPPTTGRILYVGANYAALMGCIDASEATDTYGSAFGDVRGFCARGWQGLSCLSDLSAGVVVPPELRGDGARTGSIGAAALSRVERACPSLESFTRDIIPTLSPIDVVPVVWIVGGGAYVDDDAEAVVAAATRAHVSGALIMHVVVEFAPPSQAEAKDLSRLRSLSRGGANLRMWEIAPEASSLPNALLALKLILNAITTGAHVIGRGVVIGNRMVNMSLTNHKLFLRAIGIVSDVANVSAAAAKAAILRAAYGWDDAAEVARAEVAEAKDATVALRHIEHAAVTALVIPTALVIALCGAAGHVITVAEARDALAAEPRVHLAVALVLASRGEGKT